MTSNHSAERTNDWPRSFTSSTLVMKLSQAASLRAWVDLGKRMVGTCEYYMRHLVFVQIFVIRNIPILLCGHDPAAGFLQVREG